ncbi:hypothetical protein F5877DRAFT_86373 [Lentinula edodes]|nr:hypothetical protein F5877DRAFT_86373 [Lentinula edodes]
MSYESRIHQSYRAHNSCPRPLTRTYPTDPLALSESLPSSSLAANRVNFPLTNLSPRSLYIPFSLFTRRRLSTRFQTVCRPPQPQLERLLNPSRSASLQHASPASHASPAPRSDVSTCSTSALNTTISQPSFFTVTQTSALTLPYPSGYPCVDLWKNCKAAMKCERCGGSQKRMARDISTPTSIVIYGKWNLASAYPGREQAESGDIGASLARNGVS